MVLCPGGDTLFNRLDSRCIEVIGAESAPVVHDCHTCELSFVGAQDRESFRRLFAEHGNISGGLAAKVEHVIGHIKMKPYMSIQDALQRINLYGSGHSFPAPVSFFAR